MQTLDRITFVTKQKQLEYDFPSAANDYKNNRIIVEPPEYPEEDVRHWDVIGSREGDVKIKGTVRNITERTAVTSRKGFGNALYIEYREF